jgi:hypothetical protein
MSGILVPDRCPHLPKVGDMWTCAAHKNRAVTGEFLNGRVVSG